MFTRTGRTAALAALTGCAAALAVSGCHVDSGLLQHQTRTYAVSSPVHTLVISDRVGDVQVTAGARPVSATERTSATVGSIHVTVPQASNSAHSITARAGTGSVTIRPA
jgi:hypothetical protein